MKDAKIIPEIKAAFLEFQKIRRHIHAHPELRYEEFMTSDLVASLLTQWGIEVHRGIGKTGLVGIIQAGQSNQAIGLRADMDALPMQEENKFEHVSCHEGKMHACGHDGHTAMLLAAAKYLAKHKSFDGTVYLIFQPAEEGGAGAKAMIDDGLFEKFPMQAVFGLHNWPGGQAGEMAASTGPVMASANEFKIILKGRGGHAAIPHTAIDPMPAACQLVMALQTIVSRNVNPLDSVVLSVTVLQAGTATNVIADEVLIKGTMRAFTASNVDLAEKRMHEMAHGLAAAYQLEAVVDFERSYPATINSKNEADFSHNVMTSILGASRTHAQTPTMGSEDFAFMLQEKPGCYAFIYNGMGDHREIGHGAGPCLLHNTSYDFNDELIPIGATYWVQLAQQWLEKM